jgi:hypothetical protein
MFPLRSLASGIFFAVALILSHGYRFAVKGGNLSLLPVLDAMQGVTDLGNDFNVEAYQFYHPNFYRLCLTFLPFVSQPSLFFLGYFACSVLLFFALQSLVSFLTPDRTAQASAILLLLVFGSGGFETNSFWFSGQLAPYFVAWPFAIFAVSYLLRDRPILAVVHLAVATTTHIELGMDLALVFFPLLFSWAGGPTLLCCLPLFGALVSPTLYQYLPVVASEPHGSGEFIFAEAMFRSPHHFALLPRQFIGISLGTLAVIAIGIVLPEQKNRRISALVVGIYALGLLHYLDFYFLRTGVIARLQFPRVSSLIQAVCVFHAAIFLQRELTSKDRFAAPRAALVSLGVTPLFLAVGPFTRWEMAFLTVSVFVVVLEWARKNVRNSCSDPRALPSFLTLLLVVKGIIVANSYEYYIVPNPVTSSSDAWMRTCRWATTNTPMDARFITPPDMEGFLYYAKRSMIAEFSTNPHRSSQIIEWRDRLRRLSGNRDTRCEGFACIPVLKDRYDGLISSEVASIARDYNAEFFVSRTEYDLPVVLHEPPYRIYRVELSELSPK